MRQSEQPCLSLSKTSKTGFLRGLSEAAAGFDRTVFERSFLADKKHGPDGLHLILPSASGSVAEVVAERSDEVVAAATESVEAVLDIVAA